MAVINRLKSTTILHAFILNSIASALTIIIALYVKQRMDITDQKKVTEFSIWEIIFVCFAAFSASMLSYIILFILFGFGGGMLSNPRHS